MLFRSEIQKLLFGFVEMFVNSRGRYVQFFGEVGSSRRFRMCIVSQLASQLEHLTLPGRQPGEGERSGSSTGVDFGDSNEFDLCCFEVPNLIKRSLDRMTVVVRQERPMLDTVANINWRSVDESSRHECITDLFGRIVFDE